MEKNRPPIQRARCPCFMARTDYKRSSYIRCCGHNYRYQDSSARESQYRARCCGDYEQCELYQENGGIKHDNAGSRKRT
jgi:hypothetical protein